MKAHSTLVGSEQGLTQGGAVRSGRLLAVFALSLGLTLAVVWLLRAGLPVARAASFAVTTTADAYDGVCDAHCSLRDAIVAANQNGQANTISLGSGTYVLTRTGAEEDAGLTGDLDITSTHPITIVGVGAAQTVINANGIDRILDIQPGARTVVISGVTIFNGNAGTAEGGGIRSTEASLILVNITVLSNTADYGGGVYVFSGSATLSGGQIVSNTASDRGGGVYVFWSTATFTQTGASIITVNAARRGGGVCVEYGRATLNGGQIIRNTADYGGGVYVESGSATVSGGQIVRNIADYGGGMCISQGSATVSGGQIVSNTANYGGGGVYVIQGAAMLSGGQITGNAAGIYGGGVFITYGDATLSGGQIASNTADLGGGVCIYESTAAFTQTDASIITLNTANSGGGVWINQGRATLGGGQIISNTAGYGGGIYNYTGTLTVVNSTVSGNRATTASGGGLRNDNGTSVLTFTTVASNTAAAGGGGIHEESGTVLLLNSIVAHNGTNCNVGLTSNGHNLEDDDTCGLNANGDMTDTNPLLGPLMADGGSLVHPLLVGSPAIDHGVCIAGITTDQRGAARITPCDIGAYEYVLRVYLPLVLRNL